MTAHYEGGVTEIPLSTSLPPEGVGGLMAPAIVATGSGTRLLIVASLAITLLLPTPTLCLVLVLVPPKIISLLYILFLVPA